MGKEAKTHALEEMQKLLKEEAEKRRKQIMRRDVPEDRSLANALMTLTRQELDDIRYNVGVSGTSNLNKGELVEKLIPAVVEFSGKWFVSIVDEQYQALRHVVQHDGISTEFRTDEIRLDYFQSIGVLMSGAYKDKPAWYMPTEIMEEFQRIDSGSFVKAVNWNTDMLRVVSGMLFYYGVLDYDQLFAKIKPYLEVAEDTFEFVDFMRVMFNGACWQHNVVTAEKIMYYYTVMAPEELYKSIQETDLPYAKLSYTKIYDAGEENYIEATDAYKTLAQFFMSAYEMDVLRAANVVGEITIILQNGGKMKDVLKYIDTLGAQKVNDEEHAMAPLLIAFHNSLRMWSLKGHTPAEVVSGKLDTPEDNVVSFSEHRRKKIGRNDPCPCGSGKKYKNCCLHKDEK